MLLLNNKLVRFIKNNIGQSVIDGQIWSNFDRTTETFTIEITEFAPEDLYNFLEVALILKVLYPPSSLKAKIDVFPIKSYYHNKMMADMLVASDLYDFFCIDGPLSYNDLALKNYGSFQTMLHNFKAFLTAKDYDIDVDDIFIYQYEEFYYAQTALKKDKNYNIIKYEEHIEAYRTDLAIAEETKQDQGRAYFFCSYLLDPPELTSILNNIKGLGYQNLFICASVTSPSIIVSDRLNDSFLHTLITSDMLIPKELTKDKVITYTFDFR